MDGRDYGIPKDLWGEPNHFSELLLAGKSEEKSQQGPCLEATLQTLDLSDYMVLHSKFHMALGAPQSNLSREFSPFLHAPVVHLFLAINSFRSELTAVVFRSEPWGHHMMLCLATLE